MDFSDQPNTKISEAHLQPSRGSRWWEKHLCTQIIGDCALSAVRGTDSRWRGGLALPQGIREGERRRQGPSLVWKAQQILKSEERRGHFWQKEHCGRRWGRGSQGA